MSTDAKDFHVIIIGAGSTGLLITQGLKQAGISVTVYDREYEYTYRDRPRTWSMALHWGAQYLREVLSPEMVSDLHTIETDPTVSLTPEEEGSVQMANGKTGEILFTVKGLSTRRVGRASLRRFLSRGVDVQFGKKFLRFEESGSKVLVYFADGSTASGDCLVGCDGAKSPVRATLLPPEQNQLDTVPVRCSHITASYTRDQALFIRNLYHPLVKVAPHPEQHTYAIITIADVPEPSKPETWVFQIFCGVWGSCEQPASNEERLKQMKDIMAKYCEPFRSAALWLPDDTIVPPDIFTHWTNPVKWDNHAGKITLAGDAAHPMCPFRGQGLNNALQDAAMYTEAIKCAVKGEKPLEDAITEYDSKMLERGSKEIELSAKQAYASCHWDAITSSPLAKRGFGKPGEKVENE